MIRLSFAALLLIVASLLVPRVTSNPQTARLGLGRKYSTIERVQIERLRAVHEDRLALSRGRRELKAPSGYNDYRAILHAHAEDAAHTGGTRPEMLAAAKRSGIQIIMLTDHVRPQRDFINDSWRGIREGVLFIPGAEAEGFLAYPQRSIKGERFNSRDEYMALIRRDGGNIFLCHVEERFDWLTSELDGLEIYNNHTDVKDEGQFLFWLSSSLSDPERLPLLEKALTDYPMEFFAASQDYLAPLIEKWDRDLATHRLTGVAANDCHHNQGFIVKVGSADAIEISEMVGSDKPRRVTLEQQPRIAGMIKGRQNGDVIARLDIDPYDRSMTFVTTHVLAPALSEESVRQALRSSHAYVAHDWLADPTGFTFVARKTGTDRNLGILGDEVPSAKGLTLNVEATVAGNIKLFRDGKMVKEVESNRLLWPVAAPGVYRVEVWLSVGGERRPWIYSNAIRIRPS